MDETQSYPRARAPQARRVRPDRPVAARPRRRTNWGRRLKLVLLLLVVAIAVVLFLLWQRAAAFNDAVSTESAYSMRAFGPFADGDRANVLLLGYSDESREGAYLTDSMNVLSVDRATDETTMIAIPRDLWIEGLPQVPQNMKVNEAFAIGYFADGIDNGAELAAEAVTYATGLRIHGWIALDFQGFEAMVDAIGGITVENPTAFAYAWDERDYLAGNFIDGSFDAGTLRLDGERALDYARTRYTNVVTEASDFARSVRQQRVLQAIRAEVTGLETIPHGLAVADALEGHLHTNLPVLDLAMLAGKLEVDHRLELSEDVILEASRNSIGQYVLVVIGRSGPSDYSPLHEHIAEELANQEPAPTPTPTATPTS